MLGACMRAVEKVQTTNNDWMGTSFQGKDGEMMETMLAGKTYWRSDIAYTFMEWDRAYCTAHCTENKNNYKMTRLRLIADALVWMGTPRT